MNKYVLDKELLKKWLINLALFSAPTLAVFFSLLKEGVTVEQAWPVAALVLWGSLADYFKKLKK